MNLLIKNDETVDFIMKAGKDFVKSSIGKKEALRIINAGKSEMSETHKGFPLCIDGTYYFPIVPEKKTSTKKG